MALIQIDPSMKTAEETMFHHVFPNGEVSLLVAEPGEGKSYFMQLLALKTDRQVLYYSEVGLGEFLRRGLAAKCKNSNVIFLETKDDLFGNILNFPENTVVILDTFASFFGGVDTNNYQCVNHAFQQLKDIRRTVICTHHTNKYGNVMGSISFFGSVRQALNIKWKGTYYETKIIKTNLNEFRKKQMFCFDRDSELLFAD